jgi:L-lysine exporter family protein LysE/ArgO
MTPTEFAMFIAATAGFLLGLSLIVAIGAQNAFILRQGLRREHVLPLVLTCAISDAILIALGVAGFATVLARLDWLEPLMRYGGAAFLIVYALRSARSAWAGGASLKAGETSATSFRSAFLTCLAFTWLNPHVYLDTVVLLGSISTRYAGQEVAFALGAIIASFTFFFSLGYGARLLAPLFEKPVAWRILDGVIALVMTSIAIKLVLF